MTPEQRRRLEALQKQLNDSEGGRPDACMCVLQTGGLPPGELMFGAAGVLSWTRGISDQGEITEPEEDFVNRCKAEARDAGERLIHISSFPRDEEQTAIAKLVEKYFWDHDDGVPLEEVHPISSSRRGF